MSDKLALQAALCYNEGRNIVVSEDAVNTLRRVANLLWRSTTMDTLSPYVNNGNPSPIPTTSGIYKITCTANKKIYIGSTFNLAHRKYQHFNMLRQNKHDNRYMQHAWNKYGEQSFIFEVLEFVLPISREAREQYWFNKLKPLIPKGFNINPDTSYPPKATGRKMPPAACEKIRQSRMGNTYNRGRKHTPEAIKNMSDKKMSPEAVEKTRQANLGSKRSPEARERMRQAKLGKKQTPEAIEQRRQGLLRQSPESIERRRQANLGKKRLPEFSEKMRQKALTQKREGGWFA